MRKVLEMVSLAVLAAMLMAAVLALFGPTRLPDRIPTHFDLLGRPDRWGPSRILLVFPSIAAAVYLLMTWVSRYPAAFNFPVRSMPRSGPSRSGSRSRGRLEELTLNMIAWLKTEVVCLFAWIQWTAIRGAYRPDGGVSPLLLPVLLGVVLATIFGHVTAIFRAARE